MTSSRHSQRSAANRRPRSSNLGVRSVSRSRTSTLRTASRATPRHSSNTPSQTRSAPRVSIEYNNAHPPVVELVGPVLDEASRTTPVLWCEITSQCSPHADALPALKVSDGQQEGEDNIKKEEPTSVVVTCKFEAESLRID
mmetsp:Transcript_18206/g.45552  ORF Transcript_18206/g.45552 Transcript_18206/m.45552 type:complete len:141 (-) Transcript_18206:207-629(-)|eukprot:CAMPEP_0113890776 /NCGR_PEP_ID=MMETSP0780_2-20120614/14351_1 /TAXON_ID=652834 /ORGANISM="Palpitomonas bilix" /LENGTH=140 /DNA_ID=CAMNT_0000880245 /DNA_START=562 /DNA_END=984 /DNA_ORIENTATION=- /assembly_acc=CAM_ASM_000599